MATEVFSITIRVFDDGSINMTGPLDNHVLCLGILEMAKVKVNEHNHRESGKSDQTMKALELFEQEYGQNAFGLATRPRTGT
jgi:hypothetical protein